MRSIFSNSQNLKFELYFSTVLAVQYCYVRCVSGCQDGKIRVWSLVSGDCIKVIRGNAKGDSITALFVDLDR